MVDGSQILDRLLADGRLKREQYDRIRAECARTSEHAVDLAIDYGLMTEQDVLRYLAALVRTQFVSTEKLAKAQVERPVLEMLPARAAERLNAFPLLFDRKTHTLSVVACALDVHDVAKQLAVLTQAREVKCYLARPRAIAAAIRRFYYGESGAFRNLLAAPKPAVSEHGIDVGYGVLDDGAFDERPHTPAPTRGVQQITGSIPLPKSDTDTDDFAGGRRPASSDSRTARAPLAGSASSPSIQISAPDFLAGIAAMAPAPAERAFEGDARRPEGAPSASLETLVETTHVLVSLLEQARDELRGHSAHVARLVRAVAERMGLGGVAVQELLLAAHLHDLGKASTYHLTALNVAQYDGHRMQAAKSHSAPTRMFESAKLPDATVRAMHHMYERFDGAGLPDRITGKDIPLGARILAAADTYSDVTTTTKNPYRRRLTAEEACEGLARFAGSIFDETVLGVLRLVVLGDDQRARVGAGKRVLIVDPDPEESTVLEMRLVERGLEVSIVRDLAGALDVLSGGEIELVVAEVELGDGDGFALVERIRASHQADLPVILHTRRGDRESVSRGFELGVVDYVLKPASPDVVAAKVHKTLETATGNQRVLSGRGVSGSLREMSLSDVVQLLANGRKSGKLQINASGLSGEIGFAEGHVFEASFGQAVGEEAVYAMIVLEDGEFALDTTYVPKRNLVNVSAESLLLEGMRRMDEQRR